MAAVQQHSPSKSKIASATRATSLRQNSQSFSKKAPAPVKMNSSVASDQISELSQAAPATSKSKIASATRATPLRQNSQSFSKKAPAPVEMNSSVASDQISNISQAAPATSKSKIALATRVTSLRQNLQSFSKKAPAPVEMNSSVASDQISEISQAAPAEMSSNKSKSRIPLLKKVMSFVSEVKKNASSKPDGKTTEADFLCSSKPDGQTTEADFLFPEKVPALMQPKAKKTVKKVSILDAKPKKRGSASNVPSSKVSSPEMQVKASLPPPPPQPLSNSRRRPLPAEPAKPVKYFTTNENLKDKLVGVVVTIFTGSSYDLMFRESVPTTVPGERISTYSISCSDVGHLQDALMTLPSLRNIGPIRKLPQTALELLLAFLSDDTWRTLIEDIRSVPADSIVFNWECCSGCGTNKPFPCRVADCKQASATPSTTMAFMGFAVRNGYTVMCSDFSLKSLIFEWSESELGPNPFVRVGSCSNQFCLEFIPSELQQDEVPQQLQVVGELCSEQGKAVVSAMGDTIVYTVNPDRATTDTYSLKVLTVVTDLASPSIIGSQVNRKCTIGSDDLLRVGWAGHVTLTYAAGGQLITSMGHWAELSKIDTSLDSVLRVAKRNFGDEESNSFQAELANATTDMERTNVIQKRAKSLVSKSAPTRMKCRTKC